MTSEKKLDKIRGSLIGGAIGDALGYAVEFMNLETILKRYGKRGITSLETDPRTGKALISDDTQMTLFTANGILVGETRLRMRGVGGMPHMYMHKSYQDWLRTQEVEFVDRDQLSKDRISWLMDVPQLFARRAPGNTCLSALTSARQ